MYCTSADLVARFGETEIAQLTDLEDRETVNETTVNQACLDASGEADSYLAGRYATPISGTVPAVVKAKTMDLARYLLYDDHPTETVRQNKEDAVAWFMAVAKGVIGLALDAPDSDALTGGLAYSVPADDTDNPTFTRLVW